MKHNSTKKLNEKVAIMLRLFRKYSKKLNQLVQLCESNPTSSFSSDLFNDLRNTIEQFNNTINSEKLNLMFNIKYQPHMSDYNNKNARDNEEICNTFNNSIRDDLSEFEPHSKMNLLLKYEAKIKALREQRDQLTQVNKELEYKDRKIVNGLKNKLDAIINENKDLKTNNCYLKNINNELQAKIDSISSNETKHQYYNDTITKLRTQIDFLENEMKHKESTIASFEKKMHDLQVYPINNNNNQREYDYDNDISNDEVTNNEMNKRIDSSTNIFNKKYKDNNNYSNSQIMNNSFEPRIEQLNYFKPNKQLHIQNNKESEDPSVSMFNYIHNSFQRSPMKMDQENQSEHNSLDYNNMTMNNSSSLMIAKNNQKNVNDENENYNEMINKVCLSTEKTKKKKQNNNEQPENLQNEIDALDGEIYSLKNKLKLMLTTTNNNLIN